MIRKTQKGETGRKFFLHRMSGGSSMGQRRLKPMEEEVQGKQRIICQKKPVSQQLQKADKAEKDVGVKFQILFV